MRRVTREDRWGKLTNNQVTRWVGSRQLTWEHMASKTKSPAKCKTGHEHAANENTHKPHVCTRHDNIKAHSQRNTQAACHTAQDITWMHSADKTWTACNNTKHNTCGQKSARPSEHKTAHSHNKTERGAQVFKPPSRNRNSRHECQDPNTTLQHETRHADKRAHGSSTLEAARSHETRTRRECQGSVTKPWITLDRSDRTQTFLDLCLFVFHLFAFIYLVCIYVAFIYLFVCLHLFIYLFAFLFTLFHCIYIFVFIY